MTDARTALERDRAEVAARVAALRGEVTGIMDSASSTTGDDEHDPEGSTIGFERAQAQALLDQATAHLDAITAALQRLDSGTYGQCVECGQPIAPERLEARPEADRCITCASKRH